MSTLHRYDQSLNGISLALRRIGRSLTLLELEFGDCGWRRSVKANVEGLLAASTRQSLLTVDKRMLNYDVLKWLALDLLTIAGDLLNAERRSLADRVSRDVAKLFAEMNRINAGELLTDAPPELLQAIDIFLDDTE